MSGDVSMARLYISRSQTQAENLIQDTGTVFLPMVNKEVAQFIKSCAHSQLVNSFSHKAQTLLQTIESDTPFDVLFLDFWEPGEILY